MGKVLFNLVDNAVKFTERGGITVSVDLLELQSGEATLEFRVQDTGIGMSEEQLEGLFRPFSQGDGSATRKYGGVGLGLTLGKQLVEMLGGQIAVESRLGEGSTIRFTAVFEEATQIESVVRERDRERKETREPVVGKTVVKPKSVEVPEGDAPAGAEELLVLLRRLQPHVSAGMPKQCTPIMEDIGAASWPEALSARVSDLGELIGSYRFKPARVVLESLIRELEA